MKAPFLGHSHNGVCTHKDMDHSCGCVTCTYCDIAMISCENRAAGRPCEPRVDEQKIYDAFERLVNLSDGILSRPYEDEAELQRLIEWEERLVNGEDIVVIYPYGRRVRYTL